MKQLSLSKEFGKSNFELKIQRIFNTEIDAGYRQRYVLTHQGRKTI